jgi:hypothetical protein
MSRIRILPEATADLSRIIYAVLHLASLFLFVAHARRKHPRNRLVQFGTAAMALSFGAAFVSGYAPPWVLISLGLSSFACAVIALGFVFRRIFLGR